MKEELKNLIELAESRWIDINTLTEKLYKTKLFGKLENQFMELTNYIGLLESKNKDSLNVIQ